MIEAVRYISDEALRAWVVEHGDVNWQTADLVLRSEREYLVSVGLADGPDEAGQYMVGWFGAGRPPVVDSMVIAREVEARLGIPAREANDVLNAELEYLDYLRIARQQRPDWGTRTGERGLRDSEVGYVGGLSLGPRASSSPDAMHAKERS